MTMQTIDDAAADIRAEMARRRITQRQLAERLGWNRHKLSRRINGEVEMTVAEFNIIGRAIEATDGPAPE